MIGEPLRIEITLSKFAEWRVVERSHLAAEAVAFICFNNDELIGLVKGIRQCLLDANAAGEFQCITLRRLGYRLAEIVLPAPIRMQLHATTDPVEFFLDDTSICLPVELFPCADSVLAAMVPVSRHWFCENTISTQNNASRIGNHALIVSDPTEDLPGAQNEGEMLVRKFRSIGTGWDCRFLGHSISSADFSKELPDTNLLHLAAHYVDGNSAETSGIKLENELWIPSVSSHAPELVFANCCRAGLPSSDKGELSLVGRFLKQGTHHIIAPFLPASDEVAKSFALAFYQSFFSGKNVAEAVWKARKEIGPASWIYWHFGSLQTIQISSKTPKSSASGLTVIGIVLASIIAVLVYLVFLGKKTEMPNSVERSRGISVDDHEAQIQGENAIRIESAEKPSMKIAPDVDRDF
jgi:Uncharacterized protein conserved in bacteria